MIPHCILHVTKTVDNSVVDCFFIVKKHGIIYSRNKIGDYENVAKRDQ
jgi:hypothetical protein